MSQRGSLINHLAANSPHEFKMPKVSDGVTFYSWTDRHAGTVVRIVDEKKLIIAVTYDKATRTDSNGMSDSQSYSYETNWHGRQRFFRWDKKKSQWRQVYQREEDGRWVLDSDMTISVGNRSAYHDFSF